MLCSSCLFCSLLLYNLKPLVVGDDHFNRFIHYVIDTASNEDEGVTNHIRWLVTWQQIDLLPRWLLSKFMLPIWLHLSAHRGASENKDSRDITHIRAELGGQIDRRSGKVVMMNLAADEGNKSPD